MPYTLDFSDSTKTQIVVNDGTVNTSTSLKLIGKNYTAFGEALNENLLQLLENYADGTPPSNPTEGQLWYDTTENTLMLYESGRWYSIGAPAGDTRIEYRNRQDTALAFHKTIETIVDGAIVSIITDDTTAWTPHASEYLEDNVTALTTQYPVIQAGYQLNNTTNYKFRGTATSAEYADLAERYAADAEYAPGTVVRIGGDAEVTQTIFDVDADVFGVVSTAPGFEMNSSAGTDATHPYIALAGRVPCKVVGKIKKGQRLVSSDTKGHARAMLPNEVDYRCVIGRSLESKDTTTDGFIEVVVGVK
jgi:hypothetical protein|tara:strand:+ start:1005 stop:1919 length:915 start_codon:yes stop_codon:yes gene_type:complete